jgi:glycosyltransferase involved in cell wall biosynthesis
VGPVLLRPEVAQRYKGNVELTGEVARCEVARWLERFDLLLFPSTCEGSPTAVMEAMASGLPVVSTPNSGTVVRDGQDGFIRPHDDVDGLTGAVEQLVSDTALRIDMGRQARTRVETFTLARYSESLASLFTRLMKRGSQRVNR